MWSTQWLWHPESPGVRVLVVRGFLDRLFKPKDFATLSEVILYEEYLRAQRSW